MSRSAPRTVCAAPVDGFARAVADFHTLFNLVVAAISLPLLRPYAALLRRWLPERIDPTDPARPLYLDPAARETPIVALGAAAREALRLVDVLEDMLQGVSAGLAKGDRRLLVASVVLNWVLGPALMFALAWLMLPDLPEYRTGLIIVGLARCIAMVLIWNDLACGDREAAAILVALNAVFQILAFAFLGYFYLEMLPGWLGLEQSALEVSTWQIAQSVLVFLGIPLLAGFLTRTLGEKAKGREWYEARLLPKIGPAALYGLLFTIVILFALQGETITSEPLDVARIALPLLAYFALMWGGSMLLTWAMGFDYQRATAVSFTAAGNNFELAIAVAIGVFGVASGQALAGVVGPLIEVPALVGLVYVSLWARRFFRDRRSSSSPIATSGDPRE